MSFTPAPDQTYSLKIIIIIIIIKRQQKQHDYYLLRSTSNSNTITQFSQVITQKQKLGVSKSSLSSHYITVALPQTKFPPFFPTSLFPSSALPQNFHNTFPLLHFQRTVRLFTGDCDQLSLFSSSSPRYKLCSLSLSIFHVLICLLLKTIRNTLNQN